MNRKISLALFVACIVLLAINNQFFFYGHYGYDDMHYARLSHSLLNGEIDWSDHYSYRLTLIIPTAISYGIFGVNDFASMLSPMIMTIGILFLFYLTLSDRPFFLMCTLLLYFTFKWNLFYSDKIMPDIFVSFFVFLAWIIYMRAQKNYDGKNFLPLIFSISMFLAFNAKGTVILIAPLFLYYIFKDFRKGHFLFWQKTSIISGVLFMVYFLILKAKTGNFRSRFNAISTNSYVNDCSYDVHGMEVLINRLTKGFLNLITTELLIVPLLLALTLSLFNVFKLKNKSITIYTSSIIILFLSANIMTISLTSYNPVCLVPRHLLLITPIVSVCVVKLIIQIFETIDGQLKKYGRLFLFISLAILLFPSFKYANYCRSLDYHEFKRQFKILLSDSDVNGNLYGSKVFEKMGNYILGFENRESLNLKTFEELESINISSEKEILVRNWYTEWHAGLPEHYVNNLIDRNKLITNPHGVSPNLDQFVLLNIMSSDGVN